MKNHQITSSKSKEDNKSMAPVDAFTLENMIQIVEKMPMAVSITDKLGQILYVNAQFLAVTLYESQELIGNNHSIISYKTTPIEVYKNLWNQINIGKTWQGVLVNRRKNGERYLAEITISPFQHEKGKPELFVGIHRDISDRYERNTELHNQNELISAVLNTVPTAVALLNDQQEVVLDNLTYKTLATDFHAEPVQLVTQALKVQLELDENEKILSSHFPMNSNITVELNTKNNRRWFSCRFSNLEIHNSHVDDYFNPKIKTYTVLTMTDFTREHRQQEKQRLTELQQMTTETEMMHAMQETMHAVLHQLQAPVNMMESAVNMLAKRPEQSSSLEPLMMAFNAGQDALNQLRDALPERPYEARQSVNLNQIIHEVSAMATKKLLKRSIDLQLTLNGTLPTFNAQPSRLRVALKQLIDNALEAIDFNKSSQRVIQISTKKVDDFFEVIVEDSGPGIQKSDKLKVFEPFYSTKPFVTEGSRGIGLSIVQQVVSEHRGTIAFSKSELGGCLVRVSLPHS